MAAQYGILPAAQQRMPWQEWAVLVAGLMQDTPLGRLVAARTERDPAALRRMTPWQRQVRGEWRRFLAEKAARDPRAAQREQRGLQEALARMFG